MLINKFENEPSTMIKNKVTDVLKEHNHIVKLKYDNNKAYNNNNHDY